MREKETAFINVVRKRRLISDLSELDSDPSDGGHSGGPPRFLVYNRRAQRYGSE